MSSEFPGPLSQLTLPSFCMPLNMPQAVGKQYSWIVFPCLFCDQDIHVLILGFVFRHLWLMVFLVSADMTKASYQHTSPRQTLNKMERSQKSYISVQLQWMMMPEKARNRTLYPPSTPKLVKKKGSIEDHANHLYFPGSFTGTQFRLSQLGSLG